MEVLRDDKGGKVRRFFRIKKALSGQAPVLRRLVDGWLREVINWVEGGLLLLRGVLMLPFGASARGALGGWGGSVKR